VTVVLGIDAAWTADNPSGVALVRSRGSRWECVRLAPSYASFLAESRVDFRERPSGGLPDPAALHAACVRLAGAAPDVIAIDMPLAMRPIVARRAADNAIASAYAARGLGAHSPSPERPGPVAAAMCRGFGRLGYRVAGTRVAAGTPGVMIEVFPHASAIGLLDATYRVPYKLGRMRQYWPDASAVAQRRNILSRWTKLRRALAQSIRGGELRIPANATLAGLKRYEDALDALICAWTGVQYVAGAVRAYGDASGAVWAA